jgi:hydrogenase-4 component H
MKLPKIRELGEAIKALIRGPYTLRFPKEPSIPPDTSRGQMKWDDAICVGCGACARVCPTGAIEVVDYPDADPPHRVLVRRYGMCIFCGQCHALCTTINGCNHTVEYDLACVNRDDSTEEIEKELVLCEACGEVVATRPHLQWIYEKLGPLAYTNPTVFFGFRPGTQFPLLPLERKPTRADRMRVLCPRCKREIALADRP